MDKIASGEELRDIAQEFIDLSQDIQDVRNQFMMIGLKVMNEGAVYEGKAKAELSAAVSAFTQHLGSLSEYYGLCQTYTSNAFAAMMELDKTLAEKIEGLTARNLKGMDALEVQNRDEYLKQQEDIRRYGAKNIHVE